MSLTCNNVLPGGACLMGKAFKSGPCTYCGVAGSTTADHVIARGFFPLDLRANLPKVGACQECNHKKSKLEHALTAVMPFGAQHERAKEALLAVERMLARNKSLHRLITLGFRSVLRSINGSPWVQETTVPFDGGSQEPLGEYIVKGLAHHHWGLDLGVDTYVRASFLTAEGAAAFDQFFAGNTHTVVKIDLLFSKRMSWVCPVKPSITTDANMSSQLCAIQAFITADSTAKCSTRDFSEKGLSAAGCLRSVVLRRHIEFRCLPIRSIS